MRLTLTDDDGVVFGQWRIDGEQWNRYVTRTSLESALSSVERWINEQMPGMVNLAEENPEQCRSCGAELSDHELGQQWMDCIRCQTT